MKKRVVVIGAGLCGSLVSALLRDRFDITVVEQGRTRRPLFNDVDCTEGEVNSSINRAEGMGGTTAYWHNALVEMAADDLSKAGIAAGALPEFYEKAWRFFLSVDEWRACEAVRASHRRVVESGRASVGHMVLPRTRTNVWRLANERCPGDTIRVVQGTAEAVVPCESGKAGHVQVATPDGRIRVEADAVLVCAGGLSSPTLLARSLGEETGFCGGYHDHPMAYVAKVHLRPVSRLKAVSCATTGTTEVRAGLVYESDGLKTVVYLRPALNLGLRSITGSARFILSDLRNDPWSMTKVMSLLTNTEAVREALLFKARLGFRGDYYSVLLLGEQSALATRGLALERGRTPRLNWHVSEQERNAYRKGLAAFFEDFSDEILETSILPPDQWKFRTAAHHSGAGSRFLSDAGNLDLGFFAVKDLPGTFLFDASLLRAGGIANSGLTLVALGLRFAELAAMTDLATQ